VVEVSGRTWPVEVRYRPPTTATWHKSSRSGANGCVEVAHGNDQIAVRDSKDPSGPILLFAPHVAGRSWPGSATGGPSSIHSSSTPWPYGAFLNIGHQARRQLLHLAGPGRPAPVLPHEPPDTAP
jgi:hypothetical protein